MSIVNLLPDDYILGRWRRRANWMCSILFAVVMAGVIGASVVSDQSRRHTFEVAQRIDADYADAAKLIGQLQQLEVQRNAMLSKAQSSSVLMERVPRSCLLGVIAAALPEGASLQKVDLDTRCILARDVGTRLVGGGAGGAVKASEPAVVVDIRGLAGTDVQVARLIANLARSPLVASVDLVFSQEKIVEKSPLREFYVKVVLKQNVDAMDALGAGKSLARAAGPAARTGEGQP